MPSKNMIPKGQRHHTVRPQYVAERFADPVEPVVVPVVEFEDDGEDAIRSFPADVSAAGMRVGARLMCALSWPCAHMPWMPAPWLTPQGASPRRVADGQIRPRDLTPGGPVMHHCQSRVSLPP